MRRLFALILTTACTLAFAACGAPTTSANGAGSGSPTPTGSATPTGTPSSSLCTSTGTTNSQGGTLPCLSFAIIGDTRPAVIDDNAAYPTTIITKIYQDIEAETNRPSFAISTGDYVYASPSSSNAATQFDKYLAAQQNFSGLVYHAMGNHECTGFTTSNCGTGNAQGATKNYTAYLSKMMQPLGQTKPYYVENFTAQDGSWTAKFVFIAANAWDSTQAAWLQATMAQPTTYTFVVRHEGIYANTAPGVTPSQNIIGGYPYTVLLEGHTHTFAWFANDREVITGIGGAPLTGSVNYGYVVVRQRTDGAIDFAAYDYQSHALIKHFAVDKNGGPTN